ncbi:hypothetical protein GAC73_31025 [Bacteroides thetaiotaomicron]|nr:hypothetical protein GAC73_31025 [Bacteroides thetaiotaomicron]
MSDVRQLTPAACILVTLPYRSATVWSASDKAIYKGLAELVQSEIIARGPNEYNWFINPLIVFNGDRVSFTKTYVRKKTLAAQKKEEAEKRQLSLGFDEL